MKSVLTLLVLGVVSAKGNYQQLTSGQLCSPSHPDIQTEADCMRAASELGLQWGKAWNGPGDHPGCLHATDSRDKVYFNTSPTPASTATGHYLSLCRMTRNMLSGRRMGKYEQLISGQLCSPSRPNIKTEAECREAASELGLQWGNAWNGPGDHPGCLHTTDSRNKVYFNTSPNPASTPVRNYLSLCHVPQTGVSQTNSSLTDSHNHGRHNSGSGRDRSRVQYWKMDVGVPCPTSASMIGSPTECHHAAITLGLHYVREMNGPGDWPGCLHLRNNHHVEENEVYYNIGGHRGNSDPHSKYSAICVFSNRGIRV